MFIENTYASKRQLESLESIKTRLVRVLETMRATQPDEIVWFRILKTWDGRVRLGSILLTPTYTPETGRLTIGLDSDGSRTHIDRAVIRSINDLVVKTSTKPNCTPLVRQAVAAAEGLGIRVDLTCDDFREFGLIASTYYTAAGCAATHDRRRPSFEELLGRDVDDASEMIKNVYPDMHIALRKWDLIGAGSSYDLHPEKETLVIYYDDVSKKVVLPEPRLASVQTMNGVDDHCFMMPDEGRCLGAPRVVQKDWDALIGGLVSDVADSLQYEYPHAVVEVSPVTYKIPPTRRMDRIRVLFDPETARVVAITVG